MKGDNTRSTFDKKKHYSSVRMQQGRVQLDADWNEQAEIAEYRVETETVDSIGRCGAPMHHGGFHLVATVGELTEEEQNRPENQKPPKLLQNDFYISGGRYYVNGILCENEHIVPFTKQPDVPLESLPKDFPNLEKILKEILLPEDSGTYLAYLDVWTRHITALEDPEIREKALGGPDTATRTKTIWQVKLLRVNEQKWDDLVLPPDGKLAALAKEPETKDTPCDLAPGAVYRRLENQLYRVEVHKGGELGTATFKWSRDNGSIVSKWEKQDTNDLTVSSTDRDKVLNFAGGQWVELTDDSRELLGQPGALVKLVKVEGLVLTIDPLTATGPVDLASFPGNPKVRRWDSDGEITPTKSDWIELEDGVQVQFTKGSYKTGDYWLIPARTATADVEWPLDEDQKPELQAPHGIRHHYSRLAWLHFNETTISLISDCRNLFLPVTELTNLHVQGPEPGIKVKEIVRYNENNLVPLMIDDVVPVTDFIRGLWIVCDAPIEPVAVNGRPIGTVTLELPYPLSQADRDVWELSNKVGFVGFEPIIIAGKFSMLPDQENHAIAWNPVKPAVEWLGKILPRLGEVQGGQEKPVERLLIRLNLNGNLIWGQNDPRLHLDADLFANPVSGNTDPTDPISLIYPGGDGRRGGVLNMRFWLIKE